MPASIKVYFKEEKEPVIKGTPKVPKKFSKKLSSVDGSEVLYYITTEYAFKARLDSKMDFQQKHPQDDNYSLITIPIDRI